MGVMRRVTPEDVSRFLPPRNASSRKGQNGKVLVVGGSRIYHGAPALAALAAIRSGADLAYAAVPGIVANAVRAVSPDVIVVPLADQKLTRGAAAKLAGVVPKGLDSAAIGMGLAVTDGLPALARRLTDMDVRLVLDAGALVPGVLDVVRDRGCVLTPHAGEFYRLFGISPPDDVASRQESVRQAAAGCGATILLKGRVDVISDGEDTYVDEAGVPAMTVGGTGDVLGGLVAGILARNRDPLQAATAAAYVNKRAGLQVQEKMGLHMTASDLLPVIPCVMKQFDAVREQAPEE